MEMKFDAAYKRIMKDILGKPEIVSKGNEKVNPMANAEVPKAKEDPVVSKLDGTEPDLAKGPKVSVDASGKAVMGKPEELGVPDKEKAKATANQGGQKLV